MPTYEVIFIVSRLFAPRYRYDWRIMALPGIHAYDADPALRIDISSGVMS